MQFNIVDHADKTFIDEMYNSEPIFVLSTGRSGSKYIVNFFNKIFYDTVDAYHEPSPVLEYFPNYFYNNQDKNTELRNIFNASRMELILNSAIKDKQYIESNQCLVFLSDAILELFPKAKFIHLVRSPIDFTISAMKKGWYKNDTIWEYGRVKAKNPKIWENMSHIEKLGWYWNEVNQHIENFKLKVDTKKFLTIKLEQLTQEEDSIKELISFCNLYSLEHTIDDIKKVQYEKINEAKISADEPKNIKKTAIVPTYSNWDNVEQKKFIKIVEDLSKKYEYTLDKNQYELEKKSQLRNTKNAKNNSFQKEYLENEDQRIKDLKKVIADHKNNAEKKNQIIKDLKETIADYKNNTEKKNQIIKDLKNHISILEQNIQKIKNKD